MNMPSSGSSVFAHDGLMPLLCDGKKICRHWLWDTLPESATSLTGFSKQAMQGYIIAEAQRIDTCQKAADPVSAADRKHAVRSTAGTQMPPSAHIGFSSPARRQSQG